MPHPTPGPRSFATLRAAAFLAALAATYSVGCRADAPATRPVGVGGPGADAGGRTDPPLSTGRHIAAPPATAGASHGVGSLPVNLLLSPDGKYAVTTGAGYRERLTVIRVADGQQTGVIDYPSTPEHKENGLYYGLAFGPDKTLYAAQGAAGTVAVLTLKGDGSLARVRQIKTGPQASPAGLAVDAKGRLYVAHNEPRPADKAGLGFPASVSVHDAASGAELGRYAFKTDAGLSNYPLAVAVNDDGSRLYVGSQRDDAVYALDASDPAAIKPRATIATGSHPVGLLLDKARARLFVANAHSDTVSVVDTATDKVAHTILLRPQVAQDLAGATPLGLALSANEKMLYVALGDMNAVAVIDLAEAAGPELEGYVPTGWYPTAVARAGNTLLVTNAKGDLARIPHDFKKGTKSVLSPLTLYEGTLWRLPVPNKADLKQLTLAALENSHLTAKHLGAANPLAGIGLKAGKIEHVIYVVKENRTYDHVLGDLPQGNGDPNRCLFGRAVTPNLHALAERFVLLDNFYDSGEVSGDGWTWSTQAQANEYTVRNVPYQYSGRGRVFDYEGTNNNYPTGGFPATGPDGKRMSDDPRFKEGGPAVTDVAAAPGGHLWDQARKAGLTVRNYGMFVHSGVVEHGRTVIPDNQPSTAGLRPGGRDLDGVTNVDYRRFDLNYPDSDAPRAYAERFKDPAYLWPTSGFGPRKMPSRYSEWKREFDLMLAKDPSGKAVPNLTLVRMGNDHTIGANPGKPSPRCMVADNDYGVGQLVEAVSRSPIWAKCAIVIIEDDAQNGPDHVDAHRSTCYVISPWMKKGTIDHTFQNTVSTIKTIECLLGLPPMNQYDAAAGVIGGWDDAPRNADPYAATMPPAAIMKERNGGQNAVEPVSPEQPDAASAPGAATAPVTPAASQPTTLP
ncbi:MAG: Phosphoesterase family, partial [Phycisphaerales bacterium]|nr:Phosphoesterase family [Phycisphaerales bacterium]